MPPTKRPISWLMDNVTRINIADRLDEDVLALLGTVVVRGYDADVMSRATWMELTDTGLKMAMQVVEPKTSPWPGCANIKHPLIATAAIQFAARAYPEIIKGTDVVRATVVGEDADGKKEQRAKRVSQHMSWQLLEQMEEWEEDTDNLLHALPVVGLCYRKTYWDPLIRRNKSEFRTGINIVVNNNVKDLSTARRVTDDGIWLYKNEVIERERSGQFVDGISEQFKGDEEEKPPEQFLEQHCFADLDGDGYEEPYIITVHLETQKVARIVARYDATGVQSNSARGEVKKIDPVQYFTKYPFLPAPDGTFHSLGFAQLLTPLNETINTILNQMVDAGTLHNLQGGFVGRGVKWQGGVLKFLPGEWKTVDTTGGILKDNVVPLPTREPSAVLFRLLGALTDAANRLASVSETMTGETPGQNVPATTVLAMIEQGLKVFTAVYKRVFRSLRSEYRKLYRLNRLNLDEKEYYRVLDVQGVVFKDDYDGTDLDIIPVADPTISSEAQRLARARAEMDTLQNNPTIGGRLEIMRRYYQALNVPDIDKLLPPEEIKQLTAPKGPPPPDPAMLKLESDITKQKHDYELAMERLELDRMKIEADITMIKASAIKAIAEAESKEVGQQFELYKHEVSQLTQEVKFAIDIMKEKNRARKDVAGPEGGGSPEPDTGSPGGMEAVPSDQGGPPVPPVDSTGLPGATGEGLNVESAVSGTNGPADLQDVGADIRAKFNAGSPIT